MLAACIQVWSALIDTQLVKFLRGTQLIRLVAVSVVMSHRYEVQPHMASMVFSYKMEGYGSQSIYICERDLL